MNKFTFFNDTGKRMHIHPATFNSGVTTNNGNDNVIYTLEVVVFTLPEGTTPWVKLWGDNTILVQPLREE
jgi:hypothetical protein